MKSVKIISHEDFTMYNITTIMSSDILITEFNSNFEI
jgi:hypothetical protein